VDLARRHGALLGLIGVSELSDEPFLRTATGRDLARLLREDKQRRLQELVAGAQRELPAGRVTSVLLEGEVAWHTFTRHAVQHRPDLVLVPADRGPSAGSFGTLSQHLFRKCPAPVWAIHAGMSGLPRRALVAVDPGPEGSDERLLSRELLRFATVLAAGTGMELHLAHAWSLWGEKLIASRYGAAGTQPYLDLQLQFARESSEQLMQQAGFPGGGTVVHYPKGDPGVAIPELAGAIDADVVILGSAARSGLEGFLIGSVAETILGRLRCSALVVKRPGFVSPVRA
jgi:nucleotide-binding universal stress UspA family protein